jgi:protein-glucosylgalactosylhydroxylysine glucosidase
VKITRRAILQTLPAAGLAHAAGAIDRRALVTRHNPVLRKWDPLAPLSVGNGELAFTADLTGLQTFPDFYDTAMPLCTQSQWGWHSFPGRPDGELALTPFDTHGRPVGYPTSPGEQRDLFQWLRENPHRLHLGRIGLTLSDRSQIAAPEQTLDLWTGRMTSRFRVRDFAVEVETCCHPTLDLIAVRIRSRLLEDGAFGAVIDFPYGSPAMNAADWKQPERHTTTVLDSGANRTDLARRLDDDAYAVHLAWNGSARLRRDSLHRFALLPPVGSTELSFVCQFTRERSAAPLPGAAQTFQAAAVHWQRFWTTGAAVELDGPPQARELERRVVLSQYLSAIQCSGSVPPQETGLTCNSWNGKFHLEMHWWHAAHFPLWGRAPLLERSLPWYERILPSARSWAQEQGYAGARWPKMAGPEGRDSPSNIGPLLIWQQPHPIAYAELCYHAHPNRATLERYRTIVFASAEFMASYAWLDPKDGRYHLGPPVIPAQENHPPRDTWDPVFELEYWHWGLETANRWRERLGLTPDPRWGEIARKLAPLPQQDGVYLAHANCPQTYTERNRDHPSMLGALGVLPGAKVESEVMRRTLEKVMKEWRWRDTWGWDYPMIAMAAARLGDSRTAVAALLMDTPKNTWLPNGHNWQRDNLPLYLPGNGGLLTAVAMMCAGWHGAPADFRPRFPPPWQVRHEGLRPLL